MGMLKYPDHGGSAVKYWDLKLIADRTAGELMIDLEVKRATRTAIKAVERACDAATKDLSEFDADMFVGLVCRRVVELSLASTEISAGESAQSPVVTRV
jgi:hypothetical protein